MDSLSSSSTGSTITPTSTSSPQSSSDGPLVKSRGGKGHRSTQSLPSISIVVTPHPFALTSTAACPKASVPLPDPQMQSQELTLRSRLQGVLDAHPIRTNSLRSACHALRAATATPTSRRKSLPMDSSVVNGDWSFGFMSPTTASSLSDDSYPPTPPSPSTCYPSPDTELPPSSSAIHESFDARTASELCRHVSGYVSFQDIKGLGAPPDDDDTEKSPAEAPQTSKPVSRWWNISNWQFWTLT